MKWIDTIVTGLSELYGSTDPYDLCDALNIKIIRINKTSFILRNEAAIYIRDFNNNETIFLRDDLSYKEESFYLAHEIGHAVLHPEIRNSFNKNLINTDKLEKQADYFALKLINITIDEIEMYGMTISQIACSLELPERALKQLI
ncbi:ImmA/IrrE family metallo-endopeptidase [Clostridium cylindrosporum]|uniref:Putative Zn peptidase n=1 Tax=Clostridium cylindrosporum DSM 605 TaxID=1121307 RepID=A0A0J8D6T5_CLOCY|nr:ImmA/IrrE family metallo-endopeptidase [Clostridium cylindrosporum]KMT21567.1 putative Zn peptidase [Clostridium cylindrosporum DSM 605]